MIKLPLYTVTINLRLSSDILKSVKELYKRHGLERKEDYALAGCVVTIETNIYYLFLPKSKTTHGIIAHEIDHIRHFICEYWEIRDIEEQARMVEYIHQEVYKFLKNKQVTIE